MLFFIILLLIFFLDDIFKHKEEQTIKYLILRLSAFISLISGLYISWEFYKINFHGIDKLLEILGITIYLSYLFFVRYREEKWGESIFKIRIFPIILYISIISQLKDPLEWGLLSLSIWFLIEAVLYKINKIRFGTFFGKIKISVGLILLAINFLMWNEDFISRYTEKDLSLISLIWFVFSLFLILSSKELPFEIKKR